MSSDGERELLGSSSPASVRGPGSPFWQPATEGEDLPSSPIVPNLREMEALSLAGREEISGQLGHRISAPPPLRAVSLYTILEEDEGMPERKEEESEEEEGEEREWKSEKKEWEREKKECEKESANEGECVRMKESANEGECVRMKEREDERMKEGVNGRRCMGLKETEDERVEESVKERKCVGMEEKREKERVKESMKERSIGSLAEDGASGMAAGGVGGSGLEGSLELSVRPLPQQPEGTPSARSWYDEWMEEQEEKVRKREELARWMVEKELRESLTLPVHSPLSWKRAEDLGAVPRRLEPLRRPKEELEKEELEKEERRNAQENKEEPEGESGEAVQSLVAGIVERGPRQVLRVAPSPGRMDHPTSREWEFLPVTSGWEEGPMEWDEVVPPTPEPRVVAAGEESSRKKKKKKKKPYNPRRHFEREDYVSLLPTPRHSPIRAPSPMEVTISVSSVQGMVEPPVPAAEPPIEARREARKPEDRGRYPMKTRGILFGGLRPVEIDPRIDPPPYACHNCWQPGHNAAVCSREVTREYCANCGRHGVTTATCPRCGEALKASGREEGRRQERRVKSPEPPGTRKTSRDREREERVRKEREELERRAKEDKERKEKERKEREVEERVRRDREFDRREKERKERREREEREEERREREKRDEERREREKREEEEKRREKREDERRERERRLREEERKEHRGSRREQERVEERRREDRHREVRREERRREDRHREVRREERRLSRRDEERREERREEGRGRRREERRDRSQEVRTDSSEDEKGRVQDAICILENLRGIPDDTRTDVLRRVYGSRRQRH